MKRTGIGDEMEKRALSPTACVMHDGRWFVITTANGPHMSHTVRLSTEEMDKLFRYRDDVFAERRRQLG